MTRFLLRGNLIPICFIGIVIFVAVFTAGVEKKAEKTIAKRHVSSPPVPQVPGSSSYSSYCASTEPPECGPNDDPLASDPSQRKTCTCAPSACPPGATIRMCTSADNNITNCTLFTCICNGPSASPNYCVKVLPYPEIAEVPYTPTPGGLDLGLGYGTNDADFVAMVFHQLKSPAQSSSINSDEEIMEAIVQAKILYNSEEGPHSSSSPSNDAKALALVKLAQL